MLKQEYENLYSLEENFWFFKGMRKIQFNLLEKYNKNNNLKILDTGCGTGFLMTQLKKYGEVHGIDISVDALNYCKERGLVNVHKGTIESLPFEENTFDLVTSLDVIYHKWVKSDLEALKEINRVLKKDGLLLVQEASYNFMKSSHDKAVMTRERYTKKNLKKKLEQANFEIKKITYVNTILFPIVLIKRLLESPSESSEVKKIPKFFNNLFTKILYFESSLLKNINFPFGLSIIAIAKKR